MSKMEYFCLTCITKKKENVLQIKATEEEIANQEDIEYTEKESTDDESDEEKTEKNKGSGKPRAGKKY